MVYYHPAYHHQQNYQPNHAHTPPPSPDCDCVDNNNNHPGSPPQVDRRNAHERLMDEINERNKRFLNPNRQPVATEIITVPDYAMIGDPNQYGNEKDDDEDEGLIVVGTRISESQFLIQKYKKDPDDMRKIGSVKEEKTVVQIPRRNATASCLVWTLTSERVQCTKWRDV